LYGMHRIRCRLKVGNTILLTDKTVLDKEFWFFFSEQKATSFAAVPYTYEMLGKVEFYDMKLEGLRFLSVAGGKVSKALKDRLCKFVKEKQIKFEMMYGITEGCCDVGIVLLHEEGENIGENCIGRPLSVMEWKLYDEEGQVIVGTNQVGELRMESKSCVLGYAQNCADLGKGDEWHGIYDTGDLVYLGEDGYFYMAGRKQRFEKIFGNRVSMDEIEGLVKQYTEVAECACVGKENCLYVFITSEDAGREKEIQRLLVAKTGLHGAAFRIKVIEEIPRSTSGKILYGVLKQRIE